MALLVSDDVPAIVRALPPSTLERTGVGDSILGQVPALRSQNWLVEELEGHPGDRKNEKRYAKQQYLIPIPPERSHEDFVAWDFLASAVIDSWASWSTLMWEVFVGSDFGSKEKFENITDGRYLRAFTPETRRVYDVAIFRPTHGPFIVDDTAVESGVTKLWEAIRPADPRAFPSVFGPVRFVEPVAALRSSHDGYALLQSFVSRFIAGSTFLHASFGKARVRDMFIVAFISKSEFVIIQTAPYSNTTREEVASDLSAILGSAMREKP
jgi:hypothetical protein